MSLSRYVGECHDATRCCVTGFSCWIASIEDRHPAAPRRLVTVTEHDNEIEARSWLKKELRRLWAIEKLVWS